MIGFLFFFSAQNRKESLCLIWLKRKCFIINVFPKSEAQASLGFCDFIFIKVNTHSEHCLPEMRIGVNNKIKRKTSTGFHQPVLIYSDPVGKSSK